RNHGLPTSKRPVPAAAYDGKPSERDWRGFRRSRSRDGASRLPSGQRSDGSRCQCPPGGALPRKAVEPVVFPTFGRFSGRRGVPNRPLGPCSMHKKAPVLALFQIAFGFTLALLFETLPTSSD